MSNITESRTGWVVKLDSNRQGSVTGRVVLVAFNRYAPRGADLAAMHNEWTTVGGYIEYLAIERPDRILRRGEVVR